jgi:hypothetical protein
MAVTEASSGRSCNDISWKKEEVGNNRGTSGKYSLHEQENALEERIASLQERKTHETGSH